ncbi:unnamed protein product [Linum tenue]|uniref:Subtilisin-like protease SBT1.2 n=1 Tax=Linum tenue TaxID=586396 RepID=A0AAV0JZI7_9ROSI|nr:unnamed protein product [Linum tenue]
MQPRATMPAATSSLLLLLSFFFFTFHVAQTTANNDLQTYIIQVGNPQGRTLAESEDVETWYRSFLPTTQQQQQKGNDRLLYAYHDVISGFSARLTPSEVKDMEAKNFFISARPERSLKLQTTHSPKFLGLQQRQGVWKDANFGTGVIIAVLDGGVLPSHPSFSGHGMPPPPAKWKGKCEFKDSSLCNNKLIGARSFNLAAKARSNGTGHGTHTASTAAGAFVSNADVLGNARGTAAGIAPSAHLAIYKVCFPDGGVDCAESDILAGMDAAIQDGVDVMSISKNSKQPEKQLPLVFAGAGRLSNSSLCGEGALNGLDVKGKVVLCERGIVGRIAKGQMVKDAGGAAMILMNKEIDGFSTLADLHVLPAAHVSFADGEKIKAYINSTRWPTATVVFRGTTLRDTSTSAPAMLSVSSRGPATQSKGILKPDIVGPGANIIAAWPFSLENATVTAPTFNVMTGTSMSCPHLSGVAALLKGSHPSWSPAAIKSAMMTTADVTNIAGKPIVDEKHQPADVFAIGAGHVNPTKANNPGLIYDIKPDDYMSYLCGLGYTDQQVGKIVRRNIKCAEQEKLPGGQLNYPSFSVTLGHSQTFTRTVTNVGTASSVYAVKINPPSGVYVTVKPSILSFSDMNHKATYAVTFTRARNNTAIRPFTQGYIAWTSDKYSVTSPISVTLQ